MLPLQHNVVSILYALQETAQAHFVKVEEGLLGTPGVRLNHAENVLRKVHTQVKRVLEIVKRMGTLLKSAEPRERKNTLVSVNEVWQEVRRILGKEFALGAFEIVEHLPEGFPLLRCDGRELKEIFFHLAKNAFQAMKEKGTLIIRAELGYSTQEEPVAAVTLADTGPGIPKTELACLFRPFFTTKPEKEGSGLGLYLTKELVARNGGRISVSSFEGHGTTFTMELPVVYDTLRVSQPTV